MGYYSAVRTDDIVPFAMMWLEREGIMLGEIRQPEKDYYHVISLRGGI